MANCLECGTPIEVYHKRHAYCSKLCFNRAYYRANKERIDAQHKINVRKHMPKRVAKSVQWVRDNHDRVMERQRQRRKVPHHKICGQLLCAIRKYVPGRILPMKSKIMNMLPYTAIELADHLESTLPAGYSWDDYVSGNLQLDHIIEKSKFKFNNPDDPQFKECWALKNLRLLPKEINNSPYRKKEYDGIN